MPPHASLLDCAREPLFLSTLWAALGFAVRRLRPAAPPAEDLSISDWLYRLSGSRALGENLASAMVHGIYGGDIDKLSARSVLDRAYWAYYLAPSAGGNKNNNNNVRQMPARELALMRELSQDELIRSLALRARGALLHFDRDGMESLPRALEHALRSTPNVDIVTGRPVDELRYDAATDKVEVCAGQKTKENNQGQGQGQGSSPSSYDRVIATITSEALARITADKLPSLADTRSVSVMTVNMWYPRQGLKPRGFGYLIPRSVPREQNPERALGVFFDSDIGARTSVDEPHGTKLFVLMGGHYYESGASPPPPSEAVAVEQAKSLLERHLGIPASTPCFALARLARDCIPQHHVGHHDRMVQADQELRDAFAGRLAVAGGSYTKIGAMAALRAGYDIAKQTVSGSSSSNGGGGGGSEGDDGWRTTGLEQFEFAGDIVDVPVREITVRRPSRRRR
ncbi:protoporphyrinogen oxidase [Moelleriella libera RCEF 2490]|uniref:Protoporphyrinogen oxidase n=1 Tax=Moelleriella libera RCEF 2490 TaxID=1081109 RepID=A0A162IIK7_9HYPO|nr:protoporphyrinogen oxidase [Moelleriella libera RCEF 2490]